MFRRISISLGLSLLLAGFCLQAQPHTQKEEGLCSDCPKQSLQELGPPDDPPPPETPPVPLSGIELLLCAGAFYGIRTLWHRSSSRK